MSLARLLACAALALVGFNWVARSEQIGPSFDCRVAQQPLAQMLCADPDLSRTDLRFAQAYFALLKQVGDAGKGDLKREDLQFLEAVQRQCGIPVSGQLAPQSVSSRNCVKNSYEAQRAVWALRLRSPFSEEANRPIERHIALQRSLQQLGFLPAEAAIDGVYGAGTREAISQWQRLKSRNPTGVLADAEALLVEEEASNHGQATATVGAQPAVPEVVVPEKPSATANSPSPAKPAETTELYSDPFAYCRAVGTVSRPDARYNGPEVPTVIAAAVEFIPGILGMDHVEWRCAKGGVLGCASTKAPVCNALTEAEKSRAPTTVMTKYCQEQPGSFPIPVNVAGYNNVYEWHCEGPDPVNKRQINSADEQGYNAAVWKVASDQFGVSPNYDLWRASASGNLAAIEQALKAGAEVNFKMHNGQSALHNSQTALSLAVLSDQITAAKYLLDHGASRDWLSPTAGTLLAYVQSAQMVDLLVDHSVDPNKADKNGWCPLLWSVGRFPGAKDFKPVSFELIAKGAKVGCTNNGGLTPLHFVRDPSLAKLLIDHGAEVNALDNGGFTPLHQAAARGDLDVVKVLVDAGAKNLRGKQNQLPIDLARASAGNDRAGSNQRAEVVEILSRLPVPPQGNQSGAQNQAASVQHEKLTVDMGNVNSVTAQDLERCVMRFTDIVVDLGHLFPQARCAGALPLVRIQATDSRENGPQIEVLTELTFRVLNDVARDAIFARVCTGSYWNQDLKKGGSVVVTKAVTFDKWSHQSMCDTQSLSPISKGISTNP